MIRPLPRRAAFSLRAAVLGAAVTVAACSSPGAGASAVPSDSGMMEHPSDSGMMEHPSDSGMMEQPSDSGMMESPSPSS